MGLFWPLRLKKLSPIVISSEPVSVIAAAAVPEAEGVCACFWPQGGVPDAPIIVVPGAMGPLKSSVPFGCAVALVPALPRSTSTLFPTSKTPTLTSCSAAGVPIWALRT